MDERILWKVNTTFHDWNDGHFLRKLLNYATDLELVGPVRWRKAGISGLPQEVTLERATDLLSNFPTPLPGEPPHRYLEAGGEQPWPWSVAISLAPYDEKQENPQGMSSVWLFFDRRAVSTLTRSQELFLAFYATHHIDDTEYAFIHPYQHWLDFADTYYKLPVTIAPMFKGVFWANFWGPGHLNEFDLKKLAGISAEKIQWIENNGLFLRVTENILDAELPTTEAKYIYFTNIFRDAIRMDSKWRP